MSADIAVGLLDDLAAKLSELGWTSWMDTPAGRLPSLYVRNPDPDAAALAEYIYAQPGPDGAWCYWWPWAQLISQSAAEAATIITRALRSTDHPVS